MHDHELHNYVALPSKMPRVLMQGFFLVESNHSIFSPFSDSATRSCHQWFVNCISFVQLDTMNIVFSIHPSLYMQHLKQLVYKDNEYYQGKSADH